MKKECEFYQVELMYNHLGDLLVFLFLCHHEMPLQIGHVEQGLKAQINIYTSLQLHSIRKNNYMSNVDNNVYSKRKELGIKRIFRGKRGGNYRPKTWDQNRGVHKQLLKSLPKHNILYWKGKNTRFLQTNIQYDKQTGYGFTSYGIRKHRHWLHHRDLDK